MRISDWSSDVCSSDLNSHPIKLNREQKPSHSNQTLQNGAESIFRDALRERETDFLRGKTMALRIFKSIFGSPAAITPDPLLGAVLVVRRALGVERSEEHTSELPSLMRISYAVFCLKKNTTITITTTQHHRQD